MYMVKNTANYNEEEDLSNSLIYKTMTNANKTQTIQLLNINLLK